MTCGGGMMKKLSIGNTSFNYLYYFISLIIHDSCFVLDAEEDYREYKGMRCFLLKG